MDSISADPVCSKQAHGSPAPCVYYIFCKKTDSETYNIYIFYLGKREKIEDIRKRRRKVFYLPLLAGLPY